MRFLYTRRESTRASAASPCARARGVPMANPPLIVPASEPFSPSIRSAFPSTAHGFRCPLLLQTAVGGGAHSCPGCCLSFCVCGFLLALPRRRMGSRVHSCFKQQLGALHIAVRSVRPPVSASFCLLFNGAWLLHSSFRASDGRDLALASRPCSSARGVPP